MKAILTLVTALVLAASNARCDQDGLLSVKLMVFADQEIKPQVEQSFTANVSRFLGLKLTSGEQPADVTIYASLMRKADDVSHVTWYALNVTAVSGDDWLFALRKAGFTTEQVTSTFGNLPSSFVGGHTLLCSSKALEEGIAQAISSLEGQTFAPMREKIASFNDFLKANQSKHRLKH